MVACALVDDAARAHAAPAGWDARLELRFEREPARTVLASRRHVGPLRVQRPLYPEGPDVCQVVIVHPPGGIVAGDSLAIDVDAHAGAHVQLTTPGAAKWYRSPGPPARLDTSMRVHAGALVEWLPQETLLFEGANAEIRARVELADGARFFGWEVTVLGRTASGERFGSGRVRQTLELLRGNVPLWCERAALDGGSRALRSGPILNGAPVFGTLVAAGAPVGDDVLAACRALRCASGDGAVTFLPQVLVARYLGASGSAARAYFAKLWSLLRPAFAGRGAVPPRIWNT